MTRLLALLAALLAAIPATAAPRAPWTAVATPAAAGSYLIGNPKARVRLVEYVSYTCPHCGHFTAEAGPALRAMIRSGSTSIEVRNQVHDKIDLAAATLARCAAPRAFPALHEAFLTRQEDWLPRAIDWNEGNAARIAVWPELAQLRALVDGAGLADIAAAAGVPTATIDRCFATDAALRRVLAVSAAAKVAGTPAFAINGRPVSGNSWAQLQPLLRAAGAK